MPGSFTSFQPKKEPDESKAWCCSPGDHPGFDNPTLTFCGSTQPSSTSGALSSHWSCVEKASGCQKSCHIQTLLSPAASAQSNKPERLTSDDCPGNSFSSHQV